MALSDCNRCWDTPCECGNHGYMVLRTQTPEEYVLLQELPRETFEKLQKFLQHIMLVALKPVVLSPSGERLPDIDLEIGIKVVPPAKTEPVCRMCNDTHNMKGDDRMFPCTFCLLPCDMCAGRFNGAYCAATPCDCPCHRGRG